MANLGRGGRLERVLPNFLPGILCRAVTGCAISGQAHERKGLLGRPAGERGNPLRRRKPKRVVFFRAIFAPEGRALTGTKTLKWGEPNEALLREGSSRGNRP